MADWLALSGVSFTQRPDEEGGGMSDPNDGCDPSACGAPWNEGDDGECECTRCSKARRDREREEWMIDNQREDE